MISIVQPDRRDPKVNEDLARRCGRALQVAGIRFAYCTRRRRLACTSSVPGPVPMRYTKLAAPSRQRSLDAQRTLHEEERTPLTMALPPPR